MEPDTETCGGCEVSMILSRQKRLNLQSSPRFSLSF
jgi:hypothetical protein